jgi:hypothetical protein
MMVARTIGLSKTGRGRSSLRCSWVISDRQIINPRGPQGYRNKESDSVIAKECNRDEEELLFNRE